MGLHIEISGVLERKEWEAVAAIAAIMLGETTSLASGTLAAAGIGIDADRPTYDQFKEAKRVGEGAPELNQFDEPVTAVAPPPPPLASEALLAQAAATVAPPAPMSLGGPTLDSSGLPHDLRIHGAAKSQNKDGTWRQKRGVEPALVEQVTQELRSIMAATIPPVAAVSAPVHTDPVAAFGAGSAPPAPPAPNAPLAPPPPVEAQDDGAKPEYAAFMRKVVALQTAGKVTTAQLTSIAVELGLTGIRDLAVRHEFIPHFEARLPQ